MVNFIYIINENFRVNEWSKFWFLLLLLLSYRSFKNKIVVCVFLKNECVLLILRGKWILLKSDVFVYCIGRCFVILMKYVVNSLRVCR